MLARNVAANVLQAVVGAVILFVLFRYINASLGIAQFGVWSVVLATASASRFANLGLGAGITRFVARYIALGDRIAAARIVETSVITLAILLGAALPILYFPLKLLLGHVFSGSHVIEAYRLLPYALLSLWFNDVAMVFLSGLQGFQRMDLRAAVMIAGQVLMLILAILLIPQHGLTGLAEAQIAQGVFLLLASWAILRQRLPELGWLPTRWSRKAFLEIIGYGVNVQLASLFTMLLDPVTKALMAKFGGASAAGYFEMANQVVLKVRALIVMANQAIVPKVTHMAELTPHRLIDFYKENLRILIFIALPVFALIFTMANPISEMLVGYSSPLLVHLIHLCVIAWFLNIFDVPAYFINMGTGRVGWNTISHILTGVINGVLGWIFGMLYGASGVAWAYGAAISIGSWFLVLVFQKISDVHLLSIRLKEHIPLAFACMAVAIVGNILWGMSAANNVLRWILVLAVLPAIVAVAAWYHPVRSELQTRLLHSADAS